MPPTTNPQLQVDAPLDRLHYLRELQDRVRELTPSRVATHPLYDDPLTFATECIRWPAGQSLADYQAEIIAGIPEHRREAIRGPHGLGKTTINALVVLWFAATRNASGVDWKIATTAGAWRQLEKYLWPEIHKWARRIRWDVLDITPWDTRTQLLTLNIKLTYGQAFAVASDDPALIEGVHADSVLYVFDESKAIHPGTFDAAEGAFSGAGADAPLEAFAIAASTPGEPNGRFFDIHARKPGFEDWWTRHVTADEAIAAGRMTSEWREQRRRQWGEHSQVYANRVEGEFHTSDTDGVIPLEWIEAANVRWQEWVDSGKPLTGRQFVGVDVAREGEDKTVYALRYGPVVTELRRKTKQPTTATTGDVQGILAVNPEMEAVVDVIGVGGGVFDQLRDAGYRVRAFNASETKDIKSARDRSGELGFWNLRAAAWWHLREMLDPAFGATLALPPDAELTGDLSAPRWRVVTGGDGGKIQVESKDDIRKRIGRSTDAGDGVVQACWDRGVSSAFLAHFRGQAARGEIDVQRTDWDALKQKAREQRKAGTARDRTRIPAARP